MKKWNDKEPEREHKISNIIAGRFNKQESFIAQRNDNVLEYFENYKYTAIIYVLDILQSSKYLHGHFCKDTNGTATAVYWTMPSDIL